MNVVDLPWVPVTRSGRDELIPLRDVLKGAHQIDDLATSLLPVEREAILRFLESLAAAVLHDKDPEDLANGQCIPPPLVDDFFAEHFHLFDLADRDRPFMQEWHAPQPTTAELRKNYVGVHQLHLRVPGDSSAWWSVTDETRHATDPAVLALLLIVSWFHGKPSNASGASGYRPTSDQKRLPISGAPSGARRDTVFHLIGLNLAHTLLLNIPETWLASPALPAWLDQDATPAAGQYLNTGTLWRCTWTPNRALVAWSHERPVSVTRGLTQRFIPPVGEPENAATAKESDRWKAYATAMPTGDYCRTYRTDKRTGAPKAVYAPFELRSTEGFETWYRMELAEVVAAWSRRPRVVAPERNCSIGFHNEIGDTYGNRARSEWTVVPLAEVSVTGKPAIALRAVIDHVGTAGTATRTALSKSFGKDRAKALEAQVKPHVYSALDDLVIDAVQRVAAGALIDDVEIRRQVTSAAIHAFGQATEPLLTPATAANVHRCRSLYACQIRSKEK